MEHIYICSLSIVVSTPRCGRGKPDSIPGDCKTCLAQLVERKTLNLVVVGSSPTVGTSEYFSLFCLCAIAECGLQL